MHRPFNIVSSPPLFVILFTTLVLYGPAAATLAAAAIALTHVSWAWGTGLQPAQMLTKRAGISFAVTLASLQAAAVGHTALGGTIGVFAWPWDVLPLAAAVVAYCVVGSAADVIAGRLKPAPTEKLALATARAIWRAWVTTLAEALPRFGLAACLAVAVADGVLRQRWELLPVAAIAVAVSYHLYRDHQVRLATAEHHRELIESHADGICVIDRSGNVTLWNDTLAAILCCPAERALGRALRTTVPGFATTELPQAVENVLATGTPGTLPQLAVAVTDGPRILHVTITPGADSAMLLWRDVTELTRTDRALKREHERLALAAEGAVDGLWEWDLRTQAFSVTHRWKAMIGVAAETVVSKPEEWLDRVHADDIAALKGALRTYITGHGDVLQHEHRIRHEDGSYRSFVVRGIAGKGAGGRVIRVGGSLTDTTDQRITEDRLRDVVFRDPLTGLCNRAVFVERIGRRLGEAKQRPEGTRFAVLYLDLDRFKVVNDSLGHLVGDELLVAVSRRLESCLRQGDVLARLGGDEFAILLNGLHSEQQANVIAFRVQEALTKPFSIGGREVFTSASIGIAFGLPQYTSPDEIMHDADTAMYQAKARGKARHEVFDADMDARARDRLGLENALRHAVNGNGLEMHYQPIVCLATGMCIGFESLVRWTRDGKAVSPATFIPIAEELGLIEPLGAWVLQQACQTFATWQRRFPGLDCITVNVSSRQLMQQNFLSIVERAVNDAGLRPRDLRIEITETALMASPGVAAEVLSHLRDFGSKVYLDDFGTGYSSLSHLHKLPVDALKIDRSFVRSLMVPDRPAIVESILALARTLKTGVVAEGIETAEEAAELERLGCTHAQGFLFSRPLAVAAAEELLVAHRPLGPKGVQLAVA